jgi:glycosyltransferase involved in cell wall biosynthesis
MEEAEAKLLVKKINGRRDISAWYAPAAFWPHFNRIDAPRLTCVPDVVLSEFPVAFSSVGGDRFLHTFGQVGAAIKGGDHFVTYSQHIKYRTLVDRYHVSPDAISVVPHGANRLDDLITISGFPDDKDPTEAFCIDLLHRALYKAVGTLDAKNYDSGDVRFLFYASQFRPNKNVLSLLRAYEYLLKRRYIGHKLVLTGNPRGLPEIAQFIREHNLQNDVLCLHGLTAQELAACYRLADLAVNPSLSEGGCPFTLTEALSVGTPVVMARIAVTEEVITDPDLQDAMLFDPYDWEDIAARIEWALQNREALLDRQLKFYEGHSRRTWRHVVDEHIAILNRISSTTARPEAIS